MVDAEFEMDVSNSVHFANRLHNCNVGCPAPRAHSELDRGVPDAVQQAGEDLTSHSASTLEFTVIRNGVEQHAPAMLEFIPFDGYHACYVLHYTAYPSFSAYFSCRFCDRDVPTRPTPIPLNRAEVHRNSKKHLYRVHQMLHGQAPQPMGAPMVANERRACGIANYTRIERKASCLAFRLEPTMLVPHQGSDGRRRLFYACLAALTDEPGIMENRRLARQDFVRAKLVEIQSAITGLHAASVLLPPDEHASYQFRRHLEPILQLAATTYMRRMPRFPMVPWNVPPAPAGPAITLAATLAELSDDGDDSDSDISATTDDGRKGTRTVRD
jgi:hypothetical protein